MKKRVSFNFLELIILVVVVALCTGLCSGLITYKMYNTTPLTDEDSKVLNEFTDAYKALIKNYYGSIDKQKLISSAISGMTSSVNDPYTSYLSEDETKALFDELGGVYTGVGIRVTLQDEKILIYEVLDDSPASESDLKANDEIISINDVSTIGLTLDQTTDLIKNSETDEIKFVVKREDGEHTITVNRSAKVNLPSAYYRELESDGTKIGYIYLSTFSSTTANQVQSILKKVNNAGITKLILDVRSNAGGYLLAASQIAEQFIEEGKIIYQLGDEKEKKVFKDSTATKQELQIVGLINKGSASASEILMAALKDSYGITLVGNVSYGKGKVQQTKTLSDGSTVKYTTSYWYTPNGNCIDEKGITPDYEVNLDLESDTDAQVNKALELLK